MQRGDNFLRKWNWVQGMQLHLQRSRHSSNFLPWLWCMANFNSQKAYIHIRPQQIYKMAGLANIKRSYRWEFGKWAFRYPIAENVKFYGKKSAESFAEARGKRITVRNYPLNFYRIVQRFSWSLLARIQAWLTGRQSLLKLIYCERAKCSKGYPRSNGRRI